MLLASILCCAVAQAQQSSTCPRDRLCVLKDLEELTVGNGGMFAGQMINGGTSDFD